MGTKYKFQNPFFASATQMKNYIDKGFKKPQHTFHGQQVNGKEVALRIQSLQMTSDIMVFLEKYGYLIRNTQKIQMENVNQKYEFFHSSLK